MAFYLPAVIFTHLYWFHIKFGRIRFLFGLLVALAATYGADRYLDASPRALWEASPQAIAADKAEAVPCTGTTCERQSIQSVLSTLRDNAQKRVGLSKFARSCGSDALLEAREDMKFERYCFPAGKNLDGNACCQVQQAFSNRVDAYHANPATRSKLAVYDRVFMPMKIFFVVVIVAIGCCSRCGATGSMSTMPATCPRWSAA